MWVLYAKICKYHQQCDTSQSAARAYVSNYQCVEAVYDKILCIIPLDQSLEDHAKEPTLFALPNRLPHDHPLRTSPTTQKDLTLADTTSALLCFNSSKTLPRLSQDRHT